MNGFSLFRKIYIVPVLIVFLSMYSCKTPSPCPDVPNYGNAGEKLNTGNDDYLPVVDGDVLYFTSVREEKNNTERIYRSEFDGQEFDAPELDTELPLNYYPNSISPSFTIDKVSGKKEVYFAANSPDGRANKDIYSSKFDGKKWDVPKLVNTWISTEYYESHPAISPDGSFLIFSSDRPGGYGETDLYISWRDNDHGWSEPKNLGKGINTEYEEISPCIAQDGALYFSSKGYGKASGYDIIKAEAIKKGSWQQGKAMPYPINTVFDEQGPAIFEDMVLLSSNREGGCGAYDIYAFDLCGPVFLVGNVKNEHIEIPVDGEIRLFDENEELVEEVSVDNDNSYFKIPIRHNREYVLKYSNDCMPDFEFEQEFFAPCSDSSAVKLVVNFGYGNELNLFTFEQYKVPFFVSGYYMPNTRENLEALKLKFAYNFLGSADSTKYIERPGTKYDQYTDKVDQAIGDAGEFILSKFAYFKGSCTEGGEKLVIKIHGFADPRILSETAKYDGPTLDDPKIGLRVRRGQTMTNELLSTLRAYFTAKLFQNMLDKYEAYQEFKDRVKWEVDGSGIDDRKDINNELKRRVNISVGLIK